MSVLLGMPTWMQDSLVQDEPHTHQKGLEDGIRQTKLPLLFVQADVVTTLLHGEISKAYDAPIGEDMVKSLALKMLEVPLFSCI